MGQKLSSKILKFSSVKKERIMANVKSFAIFFVMLLLIDFVPYLFAKISIKINVFFIVWIDILLSLILSAIVALGKRLGFIIANVLILIIIVLYIIEMAMYKTYGVFMPLTAITNNANNVVEYYFSEFFVVAKSLISSIAFLLLLYIIYIFVFYKSTDFYLDVDKIFYISVIAVSIILSVFTFTFTKMSSDFSLNTFRYGFKSSFIYSLYKGKSTFGFKYSNNQNDFNEDDEYYKNNNALNIDYLSLNNDEKDDSKVYINEYVSSITPSSKNEYTGIFKGKNLIMICAEAYTHHVIDKELTPTLYRLTYNGFRFNDFYVPSWGGSTSTGEYAFLTGLIACDEAETMKKTIGKNFCFTMPRVLKKDGYNTGAYHNGNYKYYDRHLTHTQNLGFDYYYATGNGIENIADPWPTDKDMIEKTFMDYHDKGPFCMYYMTLSGHAFYNDRNSYKVKKYIEKVKERYGDYYPEQIENYICYQLFLEEALTRLLELLEENNMIDDTVICMTSDHFPYGLNSAAFTNGIDYLPMLYEKETLDNFEIDENMPILWCGSLEKEYDVLQKDIDEPTSTIDLLPTLLNLFGISYDSRLLPGRDVFSDATPYVIYNNGAYITVKGKYFPYKMEFEKKEGEEISDDYFNIATETVKNKIIFSTYVLEKDYYDYLFKSKLVSDSIKNIMSTDTTQMPVELTQKTVDGYKDYFKKCNAEYIKNRDFIEKNIKLKDKTIYLTFDDGPSFHAEEIMDILDKYNIKGTFFVTGISQEKLLKKIHEKNHAIGIHTSTHDYNYIYKNVGNFLEDLYEVQNYIYTITGKYTHIYRFPGGSRNEVSNSVSYGIMKELRGLVYDIGFEYYDWNIPTADSSSNTSAEQIFDNFLHGIEKNYKENIVLMHDLYPNTVIALEKIINWGIENAYTFEKMTDATVPPHKY